MKQKSFVVTALTVLAAISVIFIFTAFGDKAKYSYQENRHLAELPEFSIESLADGGYFDKLEEYFSDHFFMRSSWLSVKSQVEAEIGDSVVNGVYIVNGMMIDTEVKDYPDSDEADEINRFAQNYDGTVYFAAIPSSTGVYSELLPEYLRNDAEKESIDALYSQLDGNIRKIDALNILQMLNENYIYYRSDSKWTSYGAYCVYRTVIQKMGFIPTEYDRYTIEHLAGDFRGNLYNKTLYSKIKPDMLDIYSYTDGAGVESCRGYKEDGAVIKKHLYERSYVRSNNMYNLYLGDDVPLMKIKTEVNNDKKLLVIKNDYANCFIPFLLQHYSEIDIIDIKNVKSGINGLINKSGYPQTLFLLGIDNFPDAEVLSGINR